MEEADALADKIAIMAYGKVRCIGNSLSLKKRYGGGYTLNLISNSGDTHAIKDLVNRVLPEALLITANSGSVMYNIPSSVNGQKLTKFLEIIENNLVETKKEGIIKDWGISHTSK
jgi:ABC-type multidrug transport system ATPase subunit